MATRTTLYNLLGEKKAVAKDSQGVLSKKK